jgi:phage-related tail protein
VGHRVIPGAGFQTGAQYAGAGMALVGEMGPELVRFGGGEQVVPSWQTAGILHSGGGGEGTINLATHNVVNVGGQRMQSQVVTQSLVYQRRNPSNNLSLRTR